MNFVVSIKNQDQLTRLSQHGKFEVVLGVSALSSSNPMSLELFKNLAQSAKLQGHRVVLLWDALMTEREFEAAKKLICSLEFNLIDAVRVKDFGALGYLKRKMPEFPIQLILETGHHSYESIISWVNYCGSQLERVILSIELPIARIAEYRALFKTQNIKCDFEIMVLGPILLFYTPRKLLSFQIKEELSRATSVSDEAVISAIASNEEDCHSDFRVTENQHGTLVYHSKDYSLIDRFTELKEAGVQYFRIDTQFDDATLYFSKLMSGDVSFVDSHSVKVTRCFAQANATDVLFKKLKNITIQRQDKQYLGEVVDFKPGSYSVIKLAKGAVLKIGSKIKVISPERREISLDIQTLRDMDLQSQNEIKAQEGSVFGIVDYIKRAPVTSQIYLE